ncbi:MAG: FAD-dependent monooxygenase [Pseudomonadota bacterium]
MDFDIVIAGGGLNGTALAVALTQAGFAVALVDPRPKLEVSSDFDGRSYALAIASQRVLAGLGLWSDLKDKTGPILEIKVSDGGGGRPPSPMVLHFDHAEIEEGPMGFMVEDRHIRPVLAEAVKARKVQIFDGVSISNHGVRPGGVDVALSDGRALAARILIGCDGANSATAKRSGIGRVGSEYGQTALVCALETAVPHDGIAHQLFLPEGPLAILPLKGNRVSTVWTETTQRARAIQALNNEGYLKELRPRFGDFLGDIDLIGDRFTYPLALSLAEAFIAERVALLGDAAHRVHPIAGQGLNAGLRDVAVLAEVLTDAKRRGEDIGSPLVLDRYQTWRRFDAVALGLATDVFNRAFSNDIAPIRMLRDLGLGAVNALPKLRRGLIREAAGLTGDLPRLARGLPL